MNARELVVGVTGGIAAYKSATLVSQLVQAGAQVTVVMTESASHFVGTATFEALTQRAVLTDIFDQHNYPLGPHIDLVADTELLCVAHATANFLAKAAAGIADDLLTTLYLSCTAKVLVAPAMSCDMWEKPAVQRNVAQLRTDGVQFVGPESGWLSCRKQGVGRMAEPAQIVKAIEALVERDPE